MKDKSFFSSAADLRQKLHNTVIRYKGEPMFCSCDGAEEAIYLRKLGVNEAQVKVSPDDRLLDFSSPPLGFINTERHCYYVGRIPVRRSVQGLHQNAMEARNLDGIVIPDRDILAGVALSNTISGIYPNWQATLARLMAARAEMSQAFSRTFALRRSGSNQTIALFHRCIPVGEYDRDRRVVILIPTYDNAIVRRELTELGVPV
jgi:hypothetical protein